MAVGTIRIFTDYREAAEGTSKGAAVTTGPNSKHAAHWRAFWRAADEGIPDVVKVKGHITAAEVEDNPELGWRRKGNAWADRLAKMGARAHFTAEHWAQAKKNEAKQEEATQLCVWIGSALGEWQQERQIRRKAADRTAMMENRRRRQTAARLAGGHRLDWTRDGWKCRYCGCTARAASGIRRVFSQPCAGHTAARIPRQAQLGAAAHVLWTAEADSTQRQVGADVTWCSVCGAYSSTKIYNLGGRCRGPAGKAALTRLRALQNLRHPVLGYRLKTPHRASDEFLEAAAARGRERRQIYDETLAESGRSNTVHCSSAGMDNPAPRLVPTWLSARSSADGMRTVPSGHVAMPSCVGDDAAMRTAGTRERDHNDDNLDDVADADDHGEEAAYTSAASGTGIAATHGADEQGYEDEDVFGHGGALDQNDGAVAGNVSEHGTHRTQAARYYGATETSSGTAPHGDAERDGGSCVQSTRNIRPRVGADNSTDEPRLTSPARSGAGESTAGKRGRATAGGSDDRTEEDGPLGAAAARGEAAAARIQAVRDRVRAKSEAARQRRLGAPPGPAVAQETTADQRAAAEHDGLTMGRAGGTARELLVGPADAPHDERRGEVRGHDAFEGGANHSTDGGRCGSCPGSSTDSISLARKTTMDDAHDVSVERHRLAAERIAAVRQRVLARCSAVNATDAHNAAQCEPRWDISANTEGLALRVVLAAPTAGEDNGRRSVLAWHDASRPAITENAIGENEGGEDRFHVPVEGRAIGDSDAKRRRLRGKGPAVRESSHGDRDGMRRELPAEEYAQSLEAVRRVDVQAVSQPEAAGMEATLRNDEL